jgi:branched-chain amino acid transport system permease protein
MPLILALIFAMAVSAGAGVLIEKFAYRPLRGTHPITTLISGIGVGIFLENLFQVIFTSDTRAFPETGIEVSVINITDTVTLTNMKLYIIAAGIIGIGILYAFLKLTRMGLAIQAAAQDIRAASLMGVNVNRVISVTFMVGSVDCSKGFKLTR